MNTLCEKRTYTLSLTQNHICNKIFEERQQFESNLNVELKNKTIKM